MIEGTNAGDEVPRSSRRELETVERFRLLIETVKDYAIFILDPNGRIETWNPGAERIKGYSEHEVLGKHFSIFYPPEDNPIEKCAFELEVAVHEGRFEEEGWRLRKDGSRFWASVVITTLRDPEQNVIGFAKVTRDLTQRREAEETRRALAEQRAILAEKARIPEFQERFLAILGHDLRNPLASIDMGTSILLAQVHTPEAARVLARMQSSTTRMTRMIEQILDLTRSRLAGGLELELRPTALHDMLTKIVDELSVAHPTSVVELDASPVHIVADQDRLEQVFSNLIGNAILHGEPTKPVVVSLQVEADTVSVLVHNQGKPISPELQAQLFDPFRRGERESRTAKTAGLGLGLYISSEIVRGHAGTIDVASSAEHGTTFRVRLPLQRRAAP